MEKSADVPVPLQRTSTPNSYKSTLNSKREKRVEVCEVLLFLPPPLIFIGVSKGAAFMQ